MRVVWYCLYISCCLVLLVCTGVCVMWRTDCSCDQAHSVQCT